MYVAGRHFKSLYLELVHNSSSITTHWLECDVLLTSEAQACDTKHEWEYIVEILVYISGTCPLDRIL